MSDDQALLLRYARSRDAGAFAQLVKRYSTLVFSIACRVTGNAATAEDVTQDCFLKLARQAESIHGSLPAWLHRVALNRSLDVTRNDATRLRHEARVSPPSGPANEPTWDQIMPLVDAALAKLPGDLREPLVQHFLLDRTQAQIAENLNIGQATVSRRLQEGIEGLREHLKKAGVVCGSALLSATLIKNASAAVPARLASSLAKMAMAGPTTIYATASITTLLMAKAKLIGVIAAVVVTGAVLTYNFVPALHRGGIPASTSKFTPRPYLSKLVLQGDGFTQDSFSRAFQAAAKVLGRDADYETIYALSTNAFCPAIDFIHKEELSYWHIQAWLGDKAIDNLCARYGLVAKNIDRPDLSGDEANFRRTIAPIINKEMQSGNVVLVCGGWADGSPWAGIVTDVKSDGSIYGATLNDLHDNLLSRPVGIRSLSPAGITLTPHEADIATLRSAVARIRSQPPFEATSEAVYGLKAMDVWIKTMSETPGFCGEYMLHIKNGNKFSQVCAHHNVRTTQIAANISARYLNRITPDFPLEVRSHLQSAATRYDRIAAMLAPALANTGPDSYSNILGNLSRQKSHVAKVLDPIKSEYSAIARDLEQALKNVKP